LVAALGIPLVGVLAMVAVAVGPLGFSVRGRTGALAWTRRLRVLAGVTAALEALLVVLAALEGGVLLAAAAAALAAVATPVLVDAALAMTAPVERRIGSRYVRRAAAKLHKIGPVVVGVTGSFGKTGTKAYLTHLLSGSLSVTASPGSFNNRLGLARTINEHLSPGTQVLVAEMGTYGPGEISEMCSWVKPTIAVITAIGPVHLERMGSEARIVAAKSEIIEQAKVAVLNIDSPWLVSVAGRAAAEGRTVWRCSASDRNAAVCVEPRGTGFDVHYRPKTLERPRLLASVEDVDAPPTNVACAVAAALELGVVPEKIANRLTSLPVPEHRRQVITAANGATLIDDTYNANPAGAAAALDQLERLGKPDARRVVVTPGMVELGRRQHDENALFAASASAAATDLVVVGSTNARALTEGAAEGGARVVRARTRDEAVAWVSGELGPGDVVLYENDLPDHYP
jgi:UDP-N-acetylmuramoyl-tripeptide--D-alanyl-D-alanine ligase